MGSRRTVRDAQSFRVSSDEVSTWRPVHRKMFKIEKSGIGFMGHDRAGNCFSTTAKISWGMISKASTKSPVALRNAPRSATPDCGFGIAAIAVARASGFGNNFNDFWWPGGRLETL